jgi:hypothetical protein
VTSRGAAAGSRDRGALSLFVAISAVGLLALCGLVLDGGGRLNAQEEATAIAREAARTGCEQIDQRALLAGRGYVLDLPSATAAAYGYLAQAKVSGSPVIGPLGCRVSIRYNYPTSTLAIIGITSLTVDATASAHFVHGVTGPERH